MNYTLHSHFLSMYIIFYPSPVLAFLFSTLFLAHSNKLKILLKISTKSLVMFRHFVYLITPYTYPRYSGVNLTKIFYIVLRIICHMKKQLPYLRLSPNRILLFSPCTSEIGEPAYILFYILHTFLTNCMPAFNLIHPQLVAIYDSLM